MNGEAISLYCRASIPGMMRVLACPLSASGEPHFMSAVYPAMSAQCVPLLGAGKIWRETSLPELVPPLLPPDLGLCGASYVRLPHILFSPPHWGGSIKSDVDWAPHSSQRTTLAKMKSKLFHLRGKTEKLGISNTMSYGLPLSRNNQCMTKSGSPSSFSHQTKKCP